MKKLLILLLAVLAATTVSHAAKKKPFYDVKSQLLGISGDIDSLKARGFATKILDNAVSIDETAFPEVGEKKKKGWTDEQIRQIANELERQRVGHKVLEVLFPFETDEQGNKTRLSDKVMNQRALYNVQFTDLEKANVGLDANSILRDDWMPLLQNNYIYIERPFIGSKQSNTYHNFNFIIFKVEIDQQVYDQVIAAWNDPEAFDQINPKVTYLYQSHEDTGSRERFQRKLSENVPAFAIRGQLTGRNPATAHIGASNGLKNGDMVTIYRQSMNEAGEMVSNRISRARVNHVDDENSQMTFIAGTKGSYKDGDMVVLTPDSKMGIGIYGNYSTGRFFGGSLMWDWINFITRAGFSGRTLVTVKVDYANYEKDLWNDDEIHFNPPVIADLNIGYGLAWTLLGRMELMPYATAGFEYARAFGKKIGNTQYADVQAAGIRAAGGLRFDLNIAYPIKLSLGAEYAHVFGLDMSKQGSSGSGGKAYWADYKDFKTLFKNNDILNRKKKLNRNGVNFYVGVRWVF